MPRIWGHVVASLTACLGVAAVLYWYHDQFWWPVDEGVYAYVAQRALAGDILHRDLIDLHGGYGNLVNIWAFQVFGEDLLSLRYPLVILTAMQSAIAYLLLARRGPAEAMAAALAVAAFSFVQFPNPSANWHALAVFFLLCLCLEWLPRGTATRLLVAGFLVGLCFFTRQLSGVFLALGLIAVLLSEMGEREGGRRSPGLLVGGIAALGLALYLLSKGQVFGFVWAGLCPLILLALVSQRARADWAEAARTAGYVTLGFALAATPLALIALSQGAFQFWISDIFVAALLINGQPFINLASFSIILEIAQYALVEGLSPVALVSSLAWVCLVLSIPVLGIVTLRRMYDGVPVPAPVILAIFWAVSALHYQIPVYLLFTLPAVLLAVLLLFPNLRTSAACLALSTYMLVFQAGQPLERGIVGTVLAQQAPPNEAAALPRVSLRIQAEDAALFAQVIALIEETARPAEPLMTLPMEPHLNFMTTRPSPVRYYGTPLGLRSPEDVTSSIAALDAAAPLFVVNRREDKYLTPLSATLLEHVRAHSGPVETVGPYDLFRYRGSKRPALSIPAR